MEQPSATFPTLKKKVLKKFHWKKDMISYLAFLKWPFLDVTSTIVGKLLFWSFFSAFFSVLHHI